MPAPRCAFAWCFAASDTQQRQLRFERQSAARRERAA